MGAGRPMRLTLFINPTGHHMAAWRHPDADADAGVNFDHYRDLVQAAEAAKFDAIFLGDNQCVRPGSPEVLSRVAQYVANFEPLTLLSALAATTSRIGLISTASTSYNYPFQIARKFASIDHISHGRSGWNMVTSGYAAEAPNFGRDEHYHHSVRYEIADDFVQTCLGLWDSWEDDAFIRDRESGIFSIPEKMHTLEHDGPYHRARGPLNVPRMPQGYPVLVQAGTSPEGRTFAARYAEMMFTTSLTVEHAGALYAEMKGRVADNGRDPDHFLIMPGLVVVVGRTTEEAHERHAELQGYLDPAVTVATLGIKMGYVDLTGYDLDEPVPESAASASEPGAFRQWMEIQEREKLTLRELAARASGSMAGVPTVGSAEDIADMMEEWFRGGAVDGFNIQPAYLPGGFTDFVDLVVPELRRRGLVRDEYEGETLRDHLGLPRPQWGSRSAFGAPK
jgi:FMN-dependent oxidoreductase (nitrilotriacetate monooxygenase family)